MCGLIAQIEMSYVAQDFFPPSILSICLFCFCTLQFVFAVLSSSLSIISLCSSNSELRFCASPFSLESPSDMSSRFLSNCALMASEADMTEDGKSERPPSERPLIPRPGCEEGEGSEGGTPIPPPSG